MSEKIPSMANKYEDARLDAYLRPTGLVAPVEHVRTLEGLSCRICFYLYPTPIRGPNR
jgi:hypothetical protein